MQAFEDVRELVEAIHRRFDGVEAQLAKLERRVAKLVQSDKEERRTDAPAIIDIDAASDDMMTSTTFYHDGEPAGISPASPSLDSPRTQHDDVTSASTPRAASMRVRSLSQVPLVPPPSSPPQELPNVNSCKQSQVVRPATQSLLTTPQPPRKNRATLPPALGKRPPASSPAQVCVAPRGQVRDAASSSRTCYRAPLGQAPSFPAIPLPNGLFVWGDNTHHRAPESWRFPATSCAAMWKLWFHGDCVHRIGPFRHLTTSDVSDVTSKIQLYYAQVVMGALLSTALLHTLAVSPEDIAKMQPSNAMSVLEMSMSLRGLELSPARGTGSGLASEQPYIQIYQRLSNSRPHTLPRANLHFL